MQSLKKYFTEGLVQVAILLSLVGIRVDVNPHYPPLREIIHGQSSALTQTQFHNFHGSLDGHGLHPKSVELDNLLSTRRLLRWVRSLDYLQVPAAQLEAWLVHREPENSAAMMPIQAGALDGDDVLVDLEDSAGLTMRMGAEDTAELGYSPVANESLQLGASLSQIDNEDVKEEDEFSLWQQEPDHNVQEQLSQGHREHLSLFNEDDEDELITDRWRNQNPFDNQLGSILGEDVQFAGLGEDTTFSIEECLQVLDANLPLEDQQHVVDADVNLPQYSGSLLSPLLSEHEPLLDLEQQWQDVLAIMEPDDMNVSDPSDNSYINVDVSRSIETGYVENPVHQNISLDQNTLPTSRQIRFGGSHEDSCPSNQNQTRLVLNNSSDMDLNLDESDIVDFLLSPPLVSSAYNNHNLHISSMEDQGLSSLFDPLLEEAMFNQISLLDLGQEEGPGQLQDSQLEEQEETDSDSGLSLHFSQSPASPSGSESSCSSSSSSWSLSSTESAPEEGAVGYAHLKEEVTDDEEGAVGGCSPEQNKMISTNFPQAGHFHVGHDHTYNQHQKQASKQRADESFGHNIQDKVSTRDEKRARAMKIPFSTDRIINLPVEEFNLLLAKHRLSEAQLVLIRDIRRRGKNKMAAQNCRRRKLDMLLGLEHSVDGLRRHRARLLREKSEILRSVKEMKQRLNDLYQEVYSRLREEQGILCSTSDPTLQQGNHSHVSLSTDYGSESRRKSNKRRNDDE